jgi:type IV pilus assembly protein PilV
VTDAPRRGTQSGDRGFTLVEVMVALVVIAIGVMALSVIQTRSSGDVYATGRQTRALNLAQERVETVRAAGYSAAVSGGGSSGPFTWATRVDSLSTDLKAVTVSVSWAELGRPRTVQLQTMLSAR